MSIKEELIGAELVNQNTDEEAQGINQNVDDEVAKVLALLGRAGDVQTKLNEILEKMGNVAQVTAQTKAFTELVFGYHNVTQNNTLTINGNGRIILMFAGQSGNTHYKVKVDDVEIAAANALHIGSKADFYFNKKFEITPNTTISNALLYYLVQS